MSGKRKIAVVITARASYSRIQTALSAIDRHEKLELCLIVSGSALLSRYGSAVDYIEKDGYKIAAKVYNVLDGGNLVSQAKTTGLGIIELTSVFENEKPDAVVSIADRYETISTAIAASYLNIPLVHIQGGEITGNIDEKVRHAITKLADLHFVSSDLAKERVIRMGEDPQKVFNTGCPSIDLALKSKESQALSFNPYQKYGGVGSQPDYKAGYLVVMQHPVTTEYQNAKEQSSISVHAVHELKIPTFWFWPNVDAGSDGTSNALRTFREQEKESQIHFFKNMAPMDFLNLISNSKCLIGNSSVGIREASFLGIPTVNIGTRQEGRERGPNVVDVGNEKVAIKSAIVQQMEQLQTPVSQIYGNGRAGEKMADLLASEPLTFSKKLQY